MPPQRGGLGSMSVVFVVFNGFIFQFLVFLFLHQQNEIQDSSDILANIKKQNIKTLPLAKWLIFTTETLYLFLNIKKWLFCPKLEKRNCNQESDQMKFFCSFPFWTFSVS